MKLRTVKKQVPKDFRKQMYENYKGSMRFYERPILPYKEWIKLVLTTKI